MSDRLLVAQHIDKNCKDLQLHLVLSHNTLAARDGRNEVRLDRVQARVKHGFEHDVPGRLVVHLLGARLERMPVKQGPEAVVALREEFGKHGDHAHMVVLSG